MFGIWIKIGRRWDFSGQDASKEALERFAAECFPERKFRIEPMKPQPFYAGP